MDQMDGFNLAGRNLRVPGAISFPLWPGAAVFLF